MSPMAWRDYRVYTRRSTGRKKRAVMLTETNPRDTAACLFLGHPSAAPADRGELDMLSLEQSPGSQYEKHCPRQTSAGWQHMKITTSDGGFDIPLMLDGEDLAGVS